MDHVVSIPTPAFVSASQAFEVHQIPAAHDNLIWLLVCKQTREVAVVDGPDAEGVLSYCRAHDLVLTHVLNTHTHFDHIGINRDLEKRGLLSTLQVIGPAKAQEQVPGITRAVTGGDEIQVGACRARVLLTEGHIVGHVCFLFDDVLFSGDALFAGGCGRVFTGDFSAAYRGLARLRALPGATRVCCAHEYTEDNLAFARSVEPANKALRARFEAVRALRREGRCAVPSLLQDELATNPMLRWDAPELIEEVSLHVPGLNANDAEAVFTATRKLKDSGLYRRTA